jgi:branched-chain amino acid transport system permease protein
MSQVWMNILTAAALDLLIGLSCFIGFLPTRFLNLSQGALIALGGYGVHLAITELHLSTWMGTIVVIPLCVLVGLVLDVNIFARLSRAGVKSWALLLASLGLYEVFQNCVSLGIGDNVKVLNPSVIYTGHFFGGAYITNIQLTIVCAAVVFFVGVFLLLHLSRLGRAIRAVASNPDLCIVFGIDRRPVRLWCVGMASGLAAVVGILSGLDANISPVMGFRILLDGIIVLIVGGVGRVGGLVGAALLLAAAQQSAAFYLDSKWIDAVAFLILIGFLIWKPLGFSGQRLKKTEI